MNTATCTSEGVHTNSNTGSCGKPWSDVWGGTGIPYHMNWDKPIEYEGTLVWEDHSSWFQHPDVFSNNDPGDNEYSFNIFRPDQSLETEARSGVHLEFNSTETVDNFDSNNDTSVKDTWWYDFHHNVVDKLNNNEDIRKHLESLDKGCDPGKDTCGPFTIVIGLLGLDLPHADHHSELHPVYAMFVRTETSPTQDKWGFFVRNWGVEGSCGPGNEPIGNQTIRVRIQHKRGPDFVVTPKVFTYAHDDSNKDLCGQNAWTFAPAEDGVLLTFSTSDASNKCGFFGDLAIDWKASNGPIAAFARASAAASARPMADNEGDRALEAKIARLEPSARQKLIEELAKLIIQPKGQATAKRKEPGKPLVHWIHPRSPATSRKHGQDLKAIVDPAEQARAEKRRQLIDAFLKVHGIQ